MKEWATKNIIDRRTSCTGVEAIIQEDDSVLFRFTQVRAEKNEIDILDHFECVDQELESVADRLTDRLSVCVSGKGVLHKSLLSADRSEMDLVSQILPGGEPADFQLQVIPNGSGAICSLIRKSTISRVLDLLRPFSGHIVDLQLGDFHARLLFTVFSTVDLVTSVHQLGQGQEDGGIQFAASLETERVYSSGDTTISSHFISSFASAVLWMSRQEYPVRQEVVGLGRTEARYGDHLRVVASLGIALLFVGLLTNYLLFQSYSREYTALEMQSIESRSLHDRVESLRLKVESDRNLAAYLGSGSTSRSSYYSDRLAATLPSGIRLISMDVFPLQRASKEGERLRIATDEIEVIGVLEDVNALNDWMEKVRTLEWVKNMQVQRFERKERSGQSEFTLMIQV